MAKIKKAKSEVLRVVECPICAERNNAILKPHGLEVGFVRASQPQLGRPYLSWPVGDEHEKFSRAAKLVIASCHQENLDEAPLVYQDGFCDSPVGRALDALFEEIVHPTKPLTRRERLKVIYRKAYLTLTNIMNGIAS